MKYLLEETQEARENSEKIVNLLLSGDIANQKLAFLLLQGGGVSTEMWSYLVGMLVFDDENNFVAIAEIKKLMQANNQSALWKVVSRLIENILPDANAFLAGKKTTLFSDFPFLDKRLVAKTALVMHKKGLAYCLACKPPILPADTALGLLVQKDMLNLSGMGLTKLPKEIGLFTEITYLNISNNALRSLPKEIGKLTNITVLNISNNPFRNLPDAMANLQRVRGLTFENISEEMVAKLENFFPKFFAEKYHQQATQDYHYDRLQQARKKLVRSLELNPFDVSCWGTLAGVEAKETGNYRQAIAYIEEGLKVGVHEGNAEDMMLAWANMSVFQHRLKEGQAALESAEKGLALCNDYPHLSTRRKPNLYFRKAQALFHLGRLEESLEVYQYALSLNPAYDVALYNVACIYAKWKQKENMLAYLRKAIAERNNSKESAGKDIDFEAYWQDEDFLALTQS